MIFLLRDEIQNMQKAKQELLATRAIDRHNSLKAKASVRRLLTSKRGLISMFGAGFVKGFISNTPTATRVSSKQALIKQLVSVWIASNTGAQAHK